MYKVVTFGSSHHANSEEEAGRNCVDKFLEYVMLERKNTSWAIKLIESNGDIDGGIAISSKYYQFASEEVKLLVMKHFDAVADSKPVHQKTFPFVASKRTVVDVFDRAFPQYINGDAYDEEDDDGRYQPEMRVWQMLSVPLTHMLIECIAP